MELGATKCNGLDSGPEIACAPDSSPCHPVFTLAGIDASNDARRTQEGVLYGVAAKFTERDEGGVIDAVPPDPFPGEYAIQRLLGCGGFGKVWLATDLHLNRLVALKTLVSNGRSERVATALAALQRDAQVLASVHHRHIVQVHAWRQSGNQPYLILQYVPGGSLEQRIQREGSLPWRVATRHIADVGAGLAEVHARGVAHCDIKPGNLLYDGDKDEVLLTDFGLAARLDMIGGGAGTPEYMAPEAFTGQVTPAMDVYSLAVSLFQIITGDVPFSGPTLGVLMDRKRLGLANPDPRCGELPPGLTQVLRAGLAADPADRCSLHEFVTHLRCESAGGAGETIISEKGPARPHRNSPQFNN